MPELGALIVAVAALLIVFAWSQIFGRVLTALRGYVPGLFRPLFDALVGADAAVYNALRGWADGVTRPFSDLLNRASAGIDSLVQNPRRFARNTYTAIQRLFTVTIPGAISTAGALTWSLYHDTLARLQATYNAVEGDLASWRAAGEAALNFVRIELQQAEQATLSFFQQAERDIQIAARVVAQDAAQVIGQEVARAEQVEQSIVQGVNADFHRLLGEVNADLHGLEGYIATVAHGLEQDYHHLIAAEHALIEGVADIDKQNFDHVIHSNPWQLLGELEKVGGEAIHAGIADLYELQRKAVRGEIELAEATREKLAPLIRDIAEIVRSGR